MNNQLPSTQEASLVLGFPRNQEINSSKHFNRIFIKVQTNSAILMQARSYNLQWWKNKVKKQSTHQTRTPGSQKKKDFVCVCETQRIAWVWTTVDPKGQRNYEQTDMVAPGRAETGLPGWWGKQWRCGRLEDLRSWGCPPGRGHFPVPALVSHPQPHHRCQTNSIHSSSHKIRFLSLFAQKRQLLSHISFI